MNISLGLFALSLLALEVPQVRGEPDISYSVQSIEMIGLGWRGEFFNRLQPVTSQGGATVWTTGVEAARALAEKAPKSLKAPRVTSASQAVAHVLHRNNRKFASSVRRSAPGAGDEITRVAYTPSYEEVREGFAISLSGRKIDQGVLTCVALDETTVAAVHQVSLPGAETGKGCCETILRRGRGKGRVAARDPGSRPQRDRGRVADPERLAYSS